MHLPEGEGDREMMTKPKIVLSFFLCLLSIILSTSTAQAQDENVFLHPDKFYKKFFPHFRIKKSPVDSTFIKTYPNYLSASTKIVLPKIYLDLSPSVIKGTNVTSMFRTNVNTIIGFSGSYRFVTAGFAIALKSNPDAKKDYANTRYRSATIKYNSAKYSLEFKFIKLNGLTDINKENSVDSTKLYTIRQDLILKEFHVEGIYNFSWKKYSYMAPIDFTERQVKSRLGFLLKAGVYNNQLYSDSNILSIAQRPYFKGFDNVSRMNSYSVKLAPGVGGNLVFMRRLYLAATIFVPYNLYFSRLYTTKNFLVGKETSIQLVFDGMVSLGYQSKRFYAGLRYQAESKRAKLSNFSSAIVYSYIGFDIGYRFKTPKIVKKIYKKTMPPGM